MTRSRPTTFAKKARSSSSVCSFGRNASEWSRAAWKISVTLGASARCAGRSDMAVGCQTVRILTLSWEYPPIVEGGLARHVRKLSEQLVRDGHEVHVVTRGGGRLESVEDRHGVVVHRVREPEFPKDDLDAFIAWVEHMNEDMLAAGAELGGGFDLVHSHDWLGRCGGSDAAGEARRVALSRVERALAGADGARAAHRRSAARPSGRRGGRARPALRLGRGRARD